MDVKDTADKAYQAMIDDICLSFIRRRVIHDDKLASPEVCLREGIKEAKNAHFDLNAILLDEGI